jgi:hypothetical protein
MRFGTNSVRSIAEQGLRVEPHRHLYGAAALACLLGSGAPALAVTHPFPARTAFRARLSVSQFSAGNGGAPFHGDSRLLTTISPNGDGLRDSATFRFALDEPAMVTLEVASERAPHDPVFTRTTRLPAGLNVLTWKPAAARPGNYLVGLDLVDATGNHRHYDARSGPGRRSGGAAPVVRVLGIDATFPRDSATPGSVATLVLATDAPSLTIQLMRSGPERIPAFRDGVMNGVAVTRPAEVGWQAHPNRPARLRLRVGAWSSGVYYARISAADGRVGYAPVIVRPRRLGRHRVAVVLPTNTWQAYNFRDQNGDGVGDTWYDGECRRCSVRLARPFLDRGEPPHFRRYDLPFLHWLAWTGRQADYLTDSDLERVASGAALARAYDLIVFPGHHEYVTGHEYDVVAGYRNLGGNLAFLCANNFFWRVARHRGVLTRTAKWRDLGRPEAGLIGVQYLANDRGAHKGPFVVRDAAAAPWLFRGTGLVDGSRFTGYGSPTGRFGIEIDATAPSSPPAIHVLADIRHLYGPRFTAQMTYYETRAGAKVFAAGAFTLGGAATWQPVERLLANLWRHLAQP